MRTNGRTRIDDPPRSPAADRDTVNRFLRFGLPLILLVIFAIIAVFVINAFEATDLMEMQRRAGPTLLNR